MNPLTHAYFALELFKGEELTQDQKDHLIVGSIIPDISQLGVVNIYRTHTQGGQFLQQANNSLERYFAWGMISHGEEPAGLDYHAHKKEGYLDLKQRKVMGILKKYKRQVGKIDNGLAHNITEFSVDYLVGQKEPALIKKVQLAFLNPKIQTTAVKFLRLLKVPGGKAEKVGRYFSNKRLHRFFGNNQSLPGLADNWFSLRFYRNLKQEKQLSFKDKIKRLTKLSYYNLKRKIKNKEIMEMFKETSSHLEKDCFLFLGQTRREVIKLKKELGRL